MERVNRVVADQVATPRKQRSRVIDLNNLRSPSQPVREERWIAPAHESDWQHLHRLHAFLRQ